MDNAKKVSNKGVIKNIASLVTRPVSFKEFLKHLLVETDKRTDDPDCVLYNSLINNGDMGADISFEGQIQETTYHRCAAVLSEGDREEVLLKSLLSQMTFAHRWYSDAQRLAEDLCVAHAMEFGVPDFLVRLGKRLWMPANPDDFKVYENNGKYAIACLAKVRTIGYRIDKITEDEVKKMVEKFKKESKQSE